MPSTPAPDYTKFKLVPDALGDVLLLNNLELNLHMWLDWALLNVGGWFNVTYVPGGPSNTTFPKTTTPERLRLVDDPNFTAGKVWEAFRMQWVWEQSIDYLADDSTTYNPNTVEVYVDGVLAVASTYVINYRLGRVIFNTAQATSAIVRAEYAFRWVQTYTMNKARWFREFQFGSLDGDNTDFLQTDGTGGGWSINGQHRVQLPAIVVEAVPRGTAAGFELGSSSLLIKQDMLFHVLAEDTFIRNNLLDALRVQQEKTIWLFDTDAVVADSAWPLDSDEDIANSNNYVDLVAPNGYRYKKCRFEKCVLEEVGAIHPDFYEGAVRITLEILYGSR